MGAYLMKRIFIAVPVLLGVLVTVFLAVRLVPGDPAEVLAGEMATQAEVERIRAQLGLDQPLWKQFGVYVAGLLQGDLGRSARSRWPVVEELRMRFPKTVLLTAAAMAVALVVGVLSGVISATRPYSLFDGTVMFGSLLGVSVPVFWLGLILMLLFAVRLDWFPAAGAYTWKHLVLPAITLGFQSAAIISRMTRSSMLEVIHQEFVRTARAKGLAERRVVYRHALRNALIPVITIAGLQTGTLLSGAVLTETVFAWPGVGRLLVDSVIARDYAVVQGCVLLIGTVFIGINLAVDLLYAYVDPRIRYQ